MPQELECQFFVGQSPAASFAAISPVVPCFFKLTAKSLSLNIFKHIFTTSANFSGCAIGVLWEPFTAIPSKFFDPITAPTPHLPAARYSNITVAILTNFSPAGPMHITDIFGSDNSSRIIPNFSLTDLPISCIADLNSILSSFITKYTGSFDFPSIIRKSYPAFFKSGPKLPPHLDSPQALVKGDLKQSMMLPPPGIRLAVRGLVANMSLFPGERGSIPLGISS
ncbi:hypothetical protein ES703_119839 [subsurface metagenome]